MSQFREYEPLPEEDKVTFKDLQIIKKLMNAKKLTETQKMALQRLYRTYMYMID